LLRSFNVEPIDSDPPQGPAPTQMQPAITSSLTAVPPLPGQASNGSLLDGLIAYYPFNGNANDESKNKIHGTNHGATLAVDRFRNSNSAFFFDGVNDYIDFGNDTRLNMANAITIAAWVNAKAYIDWAGILSKGIWGAPSPYLDYALDTKSGGYFKLTLKWGVDTVVSKQHQPNAWYHVVGTWDGNSARIYVDGILENQVPFTGSLNIDNGIMAAGVDHPGGVEYFNGYIDEIRLYNRALIEAEIRTLYNSEKP
jgi:hypothetical protein